MIQNSPLINILTYKLPFALANQIFSEYQMRRKDALYLIDTYKTYGKLKNDKQLVELLLALSIFHKRVVANLDGAVKFYGLVSRTGETDTISIGSYNLTGDEKNKLLAVVLNYHELLKKFSVPTVIMEYLETRDFLKYLISLKSTLSNASTQNKPRKTENRQEENDSDIPF